MGLRFRVCGLGQYLFQLVASIRVDGCLETGFWKTGPLTPSVQVPNNHILAKMLTYITTILKPST